LLELREKEEDPEVRKYMTAEFQKSVRRDRRQANLDAVAGNLDTATRWKGIRNMKKDYQPIPTNLWTEENGEKKKVTYKNKAEAAARFLEENIWNNKKPEGAEQQERKPKIINWDLGIRTEEFLLEELKKIIKKLKEKSGRTRQISNGVL